MNNGSRVTGSLTTVLEKYKNLAKDATSSGDYVGAENYMQHAEHYSRIINERNVRNNNYSNSSPNGSSDNSLAKENENEKKSFVSELSDNVSNKDDAGNESVKEKVIAETASIKSKKIKDVKDKNALN